MTMKFHTSKWSVQAETRDSTKMPRRARDLCLQSIQCMYQPRTRLFMHVLE